MILPAKKLLLVALVLLAAVLSNQWWRVDLWLNPIDTDHLTTQAIELYGTQWCGYCEQARNYFDQLGVSYVEYDIEQSPVAMVAYQKLGGHGIPLIRIGNQQIEGFDRSAIRDALSRATQQ